MLTKFELYQPAAIDNSLNSYQIIHKLIHEMNLIIDEVNNIDSKANEYTDEQISLLNSQLRSYIDQLNEITIAHFEAVERDILTNSGDIADLQTGLRLLSDDFDLLSASFDNLRIEVNQRITAANAAMKSYVDLQIQIVKELIEAQNPVIIDCFGHPNKLQAAYDNLFNALMYSNGGGTFGSILNKMKNFTYSTYVNMQNVSYYSFVTAMAATPTTRYLNYYLSYTNTSINVSTQQLASFKDVVTNIAACMIMLYKYGVYSGVPTSSLSDFQKALRTAFLAPTEYQPVVFNSTFDVSLR